MKEHWWASNIYNKTDVRKTSALRQAKLRKIAPSRSTTEAHRAPFDALLQSQIDKHPGN